MKVASDSVIVSYVFPMAVVSGLKSEDRIVCESQTDAEPAALVDSPPWREQCIKPELLQERVSLLQVCCYRFWTLVMSCWSLQSIGDWPSDWSAKAVTMVRLRFRCSAAKALSSSSVC